MSSAAKPGKCSDAIKAVTQIPEEMPTKKSDCAHSRRGESRRLD